MLLFTDRRAVNSNIDSAELNCYENKGIDTEKIYDIIVLCKFIGLSSAEHSEKGIRCKS